MKNFILCGMSFTNRRHIVTAKRDVKKGLYSTSFNADILPLLNLHLAKKKKDIPFEDEPKRKAK